MRREHLLAQKKKKAALASGSHSEQRSMSSSAQKKKKKTTRRESLCYACCFFFFFSPSLPHDYLNCSLNRTMLLRQLVHQCLAHVLEQIALLAARSLTAQLKDALHHGDLCRRGVQPAKGSPVVHD